MTDTFFAALVETDLQSGLSRREVAKLADKTISTGNDLLFIEVKNPETKTKAVGFINKSLCAAMGWDGPDIQVYVIGRRHPCRFLARKEYLICGGQNHDW